MHAPETINALENRRERQLEGGRICAQHGIAVDVVVAAADTPEQTAQANAAFAAACGE